MNKWCDIASVSMVLVKMTVLYKIIYKPNSIRLKVSGIFLYIGKMYYILKK